MRQQQQQAAFRRPENILITLLSLLMIGYVWVALQYLLSSPNIPFSPDPSTSLQQLPPLNVTSQRLVSQPKSLRTNPEPMVVKFDPLPKVPQKVIVEDNSNSRELNDYVTAVVECQTTHGDLEIDVRASWAPLGSKRFLDLVDLGFFTDLPFFRVCPRYITQFGAKFNWKSPFRTFPDDPSLWGVRDMNFGYLFFAGSGQNSRNDQMVISFCQTETCKETTLGHTPWEVPIGTIRRAGFNTLVNIEKTGFPYPTLEMIGLAPSAGGPDQSEIRSNPNYLNEKYPQMAYWKQCKIIQKDVQMIRHLTSDHNLEKDSANFDISRYQQNMLISPTITGGEKPIYVEFLIVINGNNEKNGPPRNLATRVVLEIIPAWAPLGAKRFIELVETFYFDNAAFFRVIKGFMAQFGIASIPSVSTHWRLQPIKDDPVLQSNSRGTISFATSGPNTRTSQLFINLVNNKYLDKEGFTPIGRVVEGMETTIDHIYYLYGEGGNGDGSDGRGPSQGRANREGKKYLDKIFPKLSYIKYATILSNYIPPK